jgi:hypothetical protein
MCQFTQGLAALMYAYRGAPSSSFMTGSACASSKVAQARVARTIWATPAITRSAAGLETGPETVPPLEPV